MPQSDRSTLVAFSVFWVILAMAVAVGYVVARGVDTGHRVAAPTVTHPHRIDVRHPNRGNGLTLAEIFSSQWPSLKGYDRRQLRTLVATGDVIPARSVNYKMTIYNDFLYPFRRTASYLRTGNLTLINLETPLINGCSVTVEGMSFCGNPRAVSGLKYAGVDVACTANNHIGNYGPPAIHETWQHLRAAGIQVCGLGNVAYRTIRGLRFAFLAYNCVSQRFDYATARREIRAAHRHADVVVVSVHWGKEYVSVPTVAPGIADDNPRRVGHWIIDSGADLVIGNHPHHVQGVEFYHGHLITYAHGNFVFDQMFGVPDCPGDANVFCTTREGVVGTYTFYRKRLVAIRYRPVVIYDYAQPRWAPPNVARIVLAGMKKSSEEIARMAGHA